MKKPAFAAAILVALAAVAGGGFVAGRRTLVAPMKEQLARNPMNTLWAGASLADIVPEEKRAAVSGCFLDGPNVVGRFDEIAWAPPAVPTPFVGFGPKPGRHRNAHVTPLQLRAERDPVLPKPRGETRVLLVGGSVAFGSGAPSQDRTVGAYLERLLEKRGGRVYALAYPWWTSSHERIVIEQRARALEADHVLVLSGANDIAAALRGDDVRWMRTPVDRFYFERVSQDYVLAGFEPLHDVVPATASVPPPDLVAERFKGNTLPGVRYLLQPMIFGSKKPLTEREKAIVASNKPETADFVRRSLDELRGSGVLLDVTDAFDGVAEDVFLDTTHVADRGNELLARRILDRLGF